MFCHTCVSALKTEKMKLSGNAKDSAFLGKARFSNWKDATVGFANHEKSATHKRAMEVVVTLSQTHRDIGEILSTNHAFEKAVNRQCLHDENSRKHQVSCTPRSFFPTSY